MLKSLYVSNYALIDHLEIGFGNGFTVITGETGAGKSIILGALSLVLGQRSDTSVLKDKDKKSVIEAEFNIENYGFETLFKSEDVDYLKDTIIRREILPGGKSRAFVNDTPVNLNFLKKISLQLIDIHSQHQNLLLGDTGFQLSVVDTVADNYDLLQDYRKKFADYNGLLKKRKVLEESNLKLKDDADYMQYQYDQLNELKLQTNEQEELEKESELLSHAEEIKGNLYQVTKVFNGDGNPILPSLKDALKNIERIVRYVPEGEEWQKRVESAYLDLDDLSSELELKMDGIEYDPERLNYVNTRLDQIFAQQQKHKVKTIEELLEIKNSLEQQLQQISSFDEDLKEIEKEIESSKSQLSVSAGKLSISRKKVLKQIEETIVNQLTDLGMPNATLKVDCEQIDGFKEDGTDNINFLFSANKNGVKAAIPKVASGGEMSRVMLCIKSLLSLSKGLPTIIFDEIDTGVSGEVADKMGDIMHSISQNIQVISITHLPQIAVKGKFHYKVFKLDDHLDTKTSIEKLSYEKRVTEVAKMLSGSNLTEAALINAKELLGNPN